MFCHIDALPQTQVGDREGFRNTKRSTRAIVTVSVETFQSNYVHKSLNRAGTAFSPVFVFSHGRCPL